MIVTFVFGNGQQNFAVPNPLEINHKWEFRYYKHSEGGYHHKLMEGGGYGNIAMTLRVQMEMG